MKEIVIHNWEELQEIIFKDVWQEDICRYRADMIYRGVGNDCFDLWPKVNRVCSHNLKLEESLIRTFRKYGYAEVGQYESFWQILTLAQHHGLPTRLLDWSYSPLVAAHFATEDINDYDKDGAIYMIDYSKLNDQLPDKIRDLLEQQKTSLCSIETLDRLARNFDELKALSSKPFAIFFEPASIHDRIINQYSLFSLVSDIHVSIEQILDNHPDNGLKIIIPKECKLEIRDKLDHINISERMIYPGLDGICKWITRRYSNLGPVYNKKHDE